MGRRLSVVVVALGIAACARRGRRDDPEPATTQPAPQVAQTTRPAVPTPAVPGVPTPDVPAAPTPDAAAQGPVVDLLRATEATVTVSSAVANANDRPEKLVDGDLTTAWSSRTGEMEQSWIEVRLPDDARVHHLEMTAGYTRQTERHDLFTGNVRIRRVRVTRGGQPVGEYDLDPAQRTMQTIPATGGGGVWRIETIGLVPGARAAWREVTVSELRVMGTPGAARRSAEQAPTVQIAGAAPAAAGGANAALEAALATLRHDVSQEGADPEGGDYGCGSGGFAEQCVRRAWAGVAACMPDLVRERCPTGLERPLRASERLWSQYARKDARTNRDEPDERREADAAEGLERYIQSFEALLGACPAAESLRRLQRALTERDTELLRGYRP